MKLANVNDHEAAKRFFDEFDISYEVISRGKNKGKLRVRPVRETDRLKIYKAEDMLKEYGLEVICDHSNVFRDREDNAVVTFSPYNIDYHPAGIDWLEMSGDSIYGMWTRTYVVRRFLIRMDRLTFNT